MFLNSTTPSATHLRNTTLIPITTYSWLESGLVSPTNDVIDIQQGGILSITVVIQESAVTSITTLGSISGPSTSSNSLFTVLGGIPSSRSNTATSISIPVPSSSYRYTIPTSNLTPFTFPTGAPRSSTSSPITKTVMTDATFIWTVYKSQAFVTVYTTIDGDPVYPISTSTPNFGNSSSIASDLVNPHPKLTTSQKAGIGVATLLAITFIALVWLISGRRHKKRRDQQSQSNYGRDFPVISYTFRNSAITPNHSSNSLERPRFELITPHTDRPNYFPHPGTEGSTHNRESLDKDGYRWPKPTVLTGDSKMFHEWTKRAQRDYQHRMKLRGGVYGGTGVVWGNEDAYDE